MLSALFEHSPPASATAQWPGPVALPPGDRPITAAGQRGRANPRQPLQTAHWHASRSRGEERENTHTTTTRTKRTSKEERPRRTVRALADSIGPSCAAAPNRGQIMSHSSCTPEAVAATAQLASPDGKRKQPTPAASPSHTHLTPKKQRVAASAASAASPAPCTPPPRHPSAATHSSATATTPVTGPLLPADESVGVTIRACKLTPRKDVQAELSEELDYLLAADR